MRWLWVIGLIFLACVGDVLILAGIRKSPIDFGKLILGWGACIGALGCFTASCRIVSLVELTVFYDAGTSLALVGYSKFVLNEKMPWQVYVSALVAIIAVGVMSHYMPGE